MGPECLVRGVSKVEPTDRAVPVSVLLLGQVCKMRSLHKAAAVSQGSLAVISSSLSREKKALLQNKHELEIVKIINEVSAFVRHSDVDHQLHVTVECCCTFFIVYDNRAFMHHVPIILIIKRATGLVNKQGP